LQQHAVLLVWWPLAIRLLSSSSSCVLLWKLLRCHSNDRAQLAANGQRLPLLLLLGGICCMLLLLL
jgi:hypothetical protein